MARFIVDAKFGWHTPVVAVNVVKRQMFGC
jgi:hypothetical protein